jgi:biopolymer transport protein ExbD
MGRKRRNAGNGVLIDLTSLLDVIFILLLVVVCSYNYEKQKNEQDAVLARESMTSAQAEAEADSKAYTDMLETQNDLQNYVWAASIVVPFEPDEITLRHIKVLREDSEIISIDLVGNDVADSIKEFRDTLTDYVKSHPDRPVILSLNENDDSILYRDEKMINEVLTELADTYDNVYIKGNISGE